MDQERILGSLRQEKGAYKGQWVRRRGKTGGTPEWFPEAKEVEQGPEGVK